jgi:hypothetical protein
MSNDNKERVRFNNPVPLSEKQLEQRMTELSGLVRRVTRIHYELMGQWTLWLRRLREIQGVLDDVRKLTPAQTERGASGDPPDSHDNSEGNG